jgi:uncharacterized protein YlxW (UPF0749 family)
MQVRRDALGQVDKVRCQLREQETQAMDALAAAQSASASRAHLQAQVRTLQSQLRDAQSQVEAGKVQLQQMMAQLHRVAAHASASGPSATANILFAAAASPARGMGTFLQPPPASSPQGRG